MEIDDNDTHFGIVILLVGQIIISIFFLIEEKVIKKYQVDSLLVVGIEGMFGMCIGLTMLTIFQKIPCESKICNGFQLCSRGICFSVQCSAGKGIAATG